MSEKYLVKFSFTSERKKLDKDYRDCNKISVNENRQMSYNIIKAICKQNSTLCSGKKPVWFLKNFDTEWVSQYGAEGAGSYSSYNLWKKCDKCK